MMIDGIHFVYKRYVNKSVLWDGFGIEQEYLDLFLNQVGEMKRGEQRDIKILFEGKTFPAIIKNLNNPQNKRLNDAYQIRYPANGEFAKALQKVFCKTFRLIQEQQKILEKENDKKRKFVKIPDEYKEYISIYSTNQKNVFVCEPILVDEMDALKNIVKNKTERVFEAEFNFDIEDNTAGINEKKMLVRVRHLNRKIGDALKAHYRYRCQICGQLIGEKYGSHLVEAHHIEYFVKSLNNDPQNQLIVCPNHHGIIHDRNPEFDRKNKIYIYPNGYREGLLLNDHL